MLQIITCRVCASTDTALDLLDVFEKQDTSECVADLLEELADIKVTFDDGYPQKCCTPCQADLVRAVSVKRKCVESDKFVRATYESICVLTDENRDSHSVKVSIPTPNYQHVTTDDNAPYRCYECSMDFANSKILKQHYETTHANVIYSWESFGISEISLFDSSDDEREGGLEKEEARFVSPEPVQANHLPRQYHCCGCMLIFDTDVDLKQHSDTTHAPNALQVEGDNVFQCNVCYRLFTNAGALENHLNTEYFLRFQCPTCGLLFGTRAHLARHEFTHMHGKFICERCDKIFSSPSSLKSHIRRIHEPPGPSQEKQKQHICSVCGKSVNSAAYLLSHMKLHSKEEPFSCKLCGARFKLVQYLKWHMAMHTGQYKCKQCETSFKSPSELQEHMNQHSGTRAFSCFLCGNGFHNKKNLNKHLRRTHSHYKRKRNV